MVRLSRWRRQSDEEVLCFPLAGHGRLALVDTRFHAEPGMHACTSSDLRGLIKFGPESMVLPVQTAISFAEEKLGGSLELPNLKFAIVVLTSLDGGMTEQDRDLLWRAFGLPVFEQLRGWDGRVIARECEVHDGLHVDAIGEMITPTELIHEPCDCGLSTPRVRLDVGRACAVAGDGWQVSR